MITKPMLAGNCEDITKLKYPIFVSPKIDGIRALTINGNAYTYSRINEKFKPLKNYMIRTLLKELPTGLDGELITLDTAGAANTFNDTQSKVMSKNVQTTFQYLVFDYLPSNSTTLPFFSRLELLSKLTLPFFVSLLPQTRLENAEQLELYEAQCVEQSYEGVMIRAINGPYKQGRSTLNEGYLLKLKRFEDAECEVIDVEELVREHHDEHTNMLGALVCKYNDVLFNIGTGFTDLQRKSFWAARFKLPKHATFKYQKHDMKNAPRMPVFKAFVIE